MIAIQLTDAVLDADHPSDLHLRGVVYDPRMGQRCATIPGDYDENGCDCPAVIGDWIVPVDAADGERFYRVYPPDAWDAENGRPMTP